VAHKFDIEMRAHSVIVPPWLFDSFRYTRQWLQRQCFAGEAACSFSELQKFLEKTTKFPVSCIVYTQFFHTGFFRKNGHPVTLIAKKLVCPLSPKSMLLHRFAWKGLPKQPFGNNIDQGGTLGSAVM
jgi:hypothetical protein